MHLKVTDAAKAALRLMAEQGSAYVPAPNAASELVGLGFAASNGHGGVQITHDGRQYLRSLDAGAAV